MQAAVEERFLSSFISRDPVIYQDVEDFVKWDTGRGKGGFSPSGSDDASIRTYLLECHQNGFDNSRLDRIRTSLESFYNWLLINDLIPENPFERSTLTLAFLSQNNKKFRHNSFPVLPVEREIAHLHALNRLAESTNRAPDVHSLLKETLETLLGVMNLNTSWITLKVGSGFNNLMAGEPPPHGYFLAASTNLPPSLEQSDRYYLRRPPECRCQRMLSTGKLKRGVNMVECSRLQEAAKTSSQNNDLMFHASVPIICNDQPIGILNIAAKEWQLLSASDLQFLTVGVSQVGSALERARLYDQIRLQHTHLAHELDMARKVQVSMFPEKLPRIRGYNLASLWKPAYETSGDYYNIFKLPGGRWGFIVADVCDKGAPAALYMALSHGLIRERVDNEVSPAALLTWVNQALYKQDIKTNFITSFYAILDPSNSSLKYALAGHPPPLLRKSTGLVKTLAGKGVALGIIPDAEYKDMEMILAPGESIVAYTDGMTDASNPSSQPYNLTHLKKVIRSAPAPARALLNHMKSSLVDWEKESPNFDDITLLVLSRNKSTRMEER
jgi:serine phosphatase RsbU (regulator of sigma subunit)